MIFVQNNRFFYTTIGLALLLLGVLFLCLYKEKTVPHVAISGFTDGTLVSDNISIAVSIADTVIKREQGLSGTSMLPENAGKLFIFENEGMYGFWMKDMNYSIDIIWIDSQMKVVGIAPSVAPESYPEVIYPPSTVQYVLEVPSGFSTEKGVEVGQTFTLKK